ncbi:hypothetical protein [Mycobacterium sp.]|uniref:hypothetical protein n=1 Tax=Mycobacterium sp. TaxID=1785 RepID=UPI0031D11E58
MAIVRAGWCGYRDQTQSGAADFHKNVLDTIVANNVWVIGRGAEIRQAATAAVR